MKQTTLIDNNQNQRIPNFNKDIIKIIESKIKLKFINEKEDNNTTFSPINLSDYIYAVLHSPKYREEYKEFLKIDFPTIPYPKDKEYFWSLVKLGEQLRLYHLMEHKDIDEFITSYKVKGNNKIEYKTNINYINNKVYINDNQYFGKVPEIVWNFFIGGYQPAQKYLKDRKNRILTDDEIDHYQRIIVELNETHKLMQEIDKIIEL